MIQIELADVSHADAPSFLLALQQFRTNGRQVPFAFSLCYDTNGLGAQGKYIISAKIYIDGDLRWISDTSNPVISNGLMNVDIRLMQVGT